MLSDTEELIPAGQIMRIFRKGGYRERRDIWVEACQRLGIDRDAIMHATDDFLFLDFLLRNTDRHYNNFGLIRDVESFAIRPAPIYDSGTSLWFDKPTGMVGSGRVTCKPFKDRHEEQIKLVSSFDWLELSKLDDIEEEWMELTKGSLFLDEARRVAVARALRGRIEMLKESSRCGTYAAPGTGHDVTEDIRYSGSR